MKKTIYYLTMVLFLLACKTENPKPPSIAEEIKGLKSVGAQGKYLNDIFDVDQQVRKNNTTILQKYGHDSQEYLAAGQEMMKTDELNLEKIELFIKTYGHPKALKHGEKAARTPWIVIHHSSFEIDSRRRNFKHLYTAWKNKNIDGGELTFYLNRFYEKEMGHMLELTSPFHEAFEIDTLVKSLNLQELRVEVDQGFDNNQ